MKNYTITVNGNVYNVTVEEGGVGSTPSTPVAPKAAAPVKVAEVSASSAAPAPVAKAAPVVELSGNAGSKVVSAAVPGKVVSIDVKVGQEVKSGDTVAVLEAMKMEIPVVSGESGVVASVETSAGNHVEAGASLITLN